MTGWLSCGRLAFGVCSQVPFVKLTLAQRRRAGGVTDSNHGLVSHKGVVCSMPKATVLPGCVWVSHYGITAENLDLNGME